MKTAILSFLALTTLVLTCEVATAQDFFDRSIQQLQAQNVQYERQLNQWMAQSRQQDEAFAMQIRRQTGDYQTPSHILIQRYVAQTRAQNPQWAAQVDRNLANNQRNFNAQNQAMQSAFNEVNQMSMNGYNNRSAMQQRGHNNYINNIHERQNYRNPYTGQRYNLSYTHQGMQTDGTNNFRQDNGRMYQYDNNGYGDMLEEDF